MAQLVMDPSKKKKYRSQKGAERTSLIATYVVLSILSLIWIIPILWIVLTAFRGDVRGTVSSNYFPTSIGVGNFVELFKGSWLGVDFYFLRWFANT